jgi:hypothetical protein
MHNILSICGVHFVEHVVSTGHWAAEDDSTHGHLNGRPQQQTERPPAIEVMAARSVPAVPELTTVAPAAVAAGASLVSEAGPVAR